MDKWINKEKHKINVGVDVVIKIRDNNNNNRERIIKTIKIKRRYCMKYTTK